MADRTCTIPGCDSPHRARGMCKSHYNRWNYSGSPSAPAEELACKVCGEPTAKSASGPRSTYCSTACRRSAAKPRAAIRNRERYRERRTPRAAKSCLTCASEFVPAKSVARIYCSTACARQMQNASRRALLRGAFVDHLHWRQIMADDGDLCHICKTAVDVDDFTRTTEGHTVLGPAYPSLDHVVALAVGGLHERANVRLAHFYCNSIKGDRPLAAVAC